MISLRLLVLGFFHFAVAIPILKDLEMVDDTVSVGTYVREARAAPVSTTKNNLIKHYL